MNVSIRIADVTGCACLVTYSIRTSVFACFYKSTGACVDDVTVSIALVGLRTRVRRINVPVIVYIVPVVRTSCASAIPAVDTSRAAGGSSWNSVTKRI